MQRFGEDAPTSLDIRADVRKVIASAYNDYSWIEEFELVGRRQLNVHTGFYARVYGQLIQVHPELAGRGHQMAAASKPASSCEARSPKGPPWNCLVAGNR